MRTHLGLTLAPALALASATPAQTVRFLDADTFAPAPGAPLAVSFLADGVPAPWPGGRVEWMFIRSGGEQRNRHDVAPQDPLQSVPVDGPRVGTALIGVDLSPVSEPLDHAELLAFLAESLPPHPPPARPPAPDAGDPIPVRRLESAALIVRAAAGGEPVPLLPSPVATSKAGLRAEIRPLMDPTVLPPGSDLPVRLYINGDKCPGALLLAANADTLHRVAANESGIALVPLSAPGRWQLRFHHAAAEPEGFALYSGTLVFHSPAAEAQP